MRNERETSQTEPACKTRTFYRRLPNFEKDSFFICAEIDIEIKRSARSEGRVVLPLFGSTDLDRVRDGDRVRLCSSSKSWQRRRARCSTEATTGDYLRDRFSLVQRIVS